MLIRSGQTCESITTRASRDALLRTAAKHSKTSSREGPRAFDLPRTFRGLHLEDRVPLIEHLPDKLRRVRVGDQRRAGRRKLRLTIRDRIEVYTTTLAVGQGTQQREKKEVEGMAYT